MYNLQQIVGSPNSNHLKQIVINKPYANNFLPRTVLQLIGYCAFADKIPIEQYLWMRCQSVVPNDVPRDFGPVIAFVN